MKPILKHKNKGQWSSKVMFASLFLILLVSVCLIILSIQDSPPPVNSKTRDELVVPSCPRLSGFYVKPFSVELTTSQTAAPIYYTLDGSEPTTKSAVYSSEIRIQEDISELRLATIPTSPRWLPPLDAVYKGVVLRAVTIEDNVRSRELVRTFFIKDEKDYTFPVVALTVNPDDLFGFENGIYVMGKKYEDKRNYIKKKIPFDLMWWNYPANYQEKGRDSERPVYIEFFDGSATPAFHENAGIRINGNATRGFSQKSLRITFDPEYGVSSLQYRLFPSITTNRFKDFILSNGGNDWAKALFRNAYIQSLMTGMALDIQATRPCIVFINGEYWGIHQLSERFDPYYLSNHHAIPVDSIAVLEVVNGNLNGGRKDVEHYERILNFAMKADFSTDSAYRQVEKVIDVNSFMDIIISNVFIGNGDWPNNNVKFWRYRNGKTEESSTGMRDGRWRWMMYDADWGFAYTGPDAVYQNLLEKVEKSRALGIIFSKMLKNKDFLNTFNARFQQQLGNRFRTDSLLAGITGFEKRLEPEMKEHISRWRVIGSFDDWKKNVEELKEFARKRPSIQREQLNTFINKYK